MEINLFQTNVEELSAQLVGTTWSVGGIHLTVKRIYVNRFTGGYCAEFTDGSWGYVATLLEKGVRMEEAA